MTEHRIPLHLVRFACAAHGTPANRVGIIGADVIELNKWHGQKNKIEVIPNEKERSTQSIADATV